MKLVIVAALALVAVADGQPFRPRPARVGTTYAPTYRSETATNGYQPSSDVLPTPVPTEFPTPDIDPSYVEPQPVYGKPAYKPAYN